MLKIVGGCLVLIGSAGVGWYMAGRSALRIRMLEELEGLLQQLYGEIEYAGCDMVELLRKLTQEARYFRKMWQSVADQLESRSAGRFQKIWQQELQQRELLLLKQEEKILLAELGQTLGQVDRQTQLYTLELYQKRLAEILRHAREEYHGQAKVYRVVGITVGFFVVILLI